VYAITKTVHWRITKRHTACYSDSVIFPIPENSFMLTHENHENPFMLARRILSKQNAVKLEWGPVPNVMAALPNIGSALCSTPQSLADAHYYTVPCSNAAKTRNPLNLHGCPKLANGPQPLVGRSSPYYEDMWRRYHCLTSFFPDCRHMPQLLRHSRTKLWDKAKMAIFCVPYFHRAACSTFQTCILNSH